VGCVSSGSHSPPREGHDGDRIRSLWLLMGRSTGSWHRRGQGGACGRRAARVCDCSNAGTRAVPTEFPTQSRAEPSREGNVLPLGQLGIGLKISHMDTSTRSRSPGHPASLERLFAPLAVFSSSIARPSAAFLERLRATAVGSKSGHSHPQAPRAMAGHETDKLSAVANRLRSFSWAVERAAARWEHWATRPNQGTDRGDRFLGLLRQPSMFS
jgi:hypothetical protein